MNPPTTITATLLHRTAVLAVLLLLGSGCGEPIEPITTDLSGISGSWSCSTDASGESWTFSVIIAGPANDNTTRVWVDDVSAPATESHLLTVQGASAASITFGGTVAGTLPGEVPEAGAIPQSCEDADNLWIRFCGSPDGMPYEVPCWICGEGDDGDLPDEADGWLDCS
jgi:hypothetical protein